MSFREGKKKHLKGFGPSSPRVINSFDNIAIDFWQEVKGRMEMLKFPIQSDRLLGINHGRNLGGHLQGPIYTTFIFFPKTAAFRTPTFRFLLITRQLDSWLHVACYIFFLCFTVEHYPGT